ncbi:MAG TPA: hypothetical protein VKV15_28055 [Bryobacteraceae bacterium]|nr:hypothetical protein [Bryobacteraceae bacterium]
MKKTLALLLALPLVAAAPAGFVYWSAAGLKSIEQGLAGKKTGIQQLENFGNHSTMMVHREVSGEVELHQKMVDVMMIENGSATLAVGGEVVNGRTTAPGEIRGASINGGIKQKVAVGDIIHIPANTPHQVLLDPGKQISYFVVKVAAK